MLHRCFRHFARHPHHLAGVMLGLAGLAGLTVLYFSNPVDSWWIPACPLYQITGIYCSGCGAGRGMYALLHGNWRASLALNPLLLPMMLTAGLALWKPGWFMKPAVTGAIVVILLVYSVFRNLPAFACLAPH